MRPTLSTLRLVAIGCLLPVTAAAQIPIPKVPASGSRPAKRGKVAKAKARVEALGAQAALIKEMKKWASTNKSELQKIYTNSLDNFKQARTAIYRAKGQAVPRYKPPQGFEVSVARLSGSSSYPTYSSYKVPTVDPDDFYIHVQADYPDEWVKGRRRMRIKWYIYDDSYLPTASPYQNEDKAIYRSKYHSKGISTRSIRYRNHVTGLGLLPGRYFAAVVFRESYTAGKHKSYSKREKQVSLAAFRIARSAPPGVKLLLPHFRDWYGTYKKKITLGSVRASGNKRRITVSGSFDRAEFNPDLAPAYIEVATTTGARVIYRARVKIRKATNNRFSAKIGKHGLSPGTHRLRVTIYTEYATGRKYYKPFEGCRSEQKVEVTVR